MEKVKKPMCRVRAGPTEAVVRLLHPNFTFRDNSAPPSRESQLAGSGVEQQQVSSLPVEQTGASSSIAQGFPQFAPQAAAGLGSSEGLNWLTELEYEVFMEMNLARTDPKAYSEKIARRQKHFKGHTVWDPENPRRGFTTHEGPKAYEDALAFLGTQPPVPALQDVKRGMNLACIDHYRDCGPKGIIGHSGTDDSRVDQRLERYGTWFGKAYECIVYGATTAEDIVVIMAVDDGVLSRCHRKLLFKPELTVAGVGVGFHSALAAMCTITFAEAFVDYPLQQQREAHQSYAQKLHPDNEVSLCTRCGEEVPAESGVYANGYRWHTNCFMCVSCAVPIEFYTTDARYNKNAKPASERDPLDAYCRNCFEQKCANFCVACGSKVLRVATSIDDQPHCCQCFQALIQREQQ